MSGNEDDGKFGEPLPKHFALQGESAHPGHADVEKKTAGDGGIVFFEKSLGRGVADAGLVRTVEEEGETFAHLGIVVDDAYERFDSNLGGDGCGHVSDVLVVVGFSSPEQGRVMTAATPPKEAPLPRVFSPVVSNTQRRKLPECASAIEETI